MVTPIISSSEPTPQCFVTKLLNNEVNKDKTPSIQYYFFDKTDIIFSYLVGVADITNKIPVTENTAYHFFSITKTFTAVAVMQLHETGLLDINFPVKRYLPEFPYGEKVMIKHLLNHSAGVPNPIPLSWIHLVEEHTTFDMNAFFDTIFQRYRHLKFQPNERFSYSNLGFVLLGQLIEKVTGQSYEEYVTKSIINKLQLSEGELGFDLSDFDAQAKGYHKRYSLVNFILGLLINKNKFLDNPEGKWRPFRPFYINGASYGGLIGKPRVLIPFLQELLKENSSLLSTASRQQLLTENKTNAGNKTGMCLGWFKGELNEEEYFTHAGGGGGYYCEIRFYPNLERGSIIFFNRSGMGDERFLDNVDRHFIPGNK